MCMSWGAGSPETAEISACVEGINLEACDAIRLPVGLSLALPPSKALELILNSQLHVSFS